MFENAVHWILVGLLLFVSVLMTFFILLQEGKGGGLTALGGTRAAGVEGVTNPIRRATAVLAVIWFLCAGALAVASRGKGGETTNALYENPATKKKDDDKPAGQPPAFAPALSPINNGGEMKAAPTPGSVPPGAPVAPAVVPAVPPAVNPTGENKPATPPPANATPPGLTNAPAAVPEVAPVAPPGAPAATDTKDKAAVAPEANKDAEKKPDAAAPAPAPAKAP